VRCGIAQLAAACLVGALVVLPDPGAAHQRRRSTTSASGTVYIESNSSAPGSNAVLAFHYANGVLSGRGVRRYLTGGSGSHDLSNSGVLDADQELITNPQRTLLFAVNSSSDTIAIFHIHAGGALIPATGSPFPSGGRAPSSLGLAGSTLIVANKSQDGVRDLTRAPANYTSFHVRADGSLSRAEGQGPDRPAPAAPREGGRGASEPYPPGRSCLGVFRPPRRRGPCDVRPAGRGAALGVGDEARHGARRARRRGGGRDRPRRACRP